MPAGLYIPKSTEGAQLDAAKKFVAFVASTEGCDVQTKAYPPAGPYMVKGCTLPADVPQAVKDLVAYVDDAGTSRRRWSSCPRSRDRPWSRSPSRSGSGLRSAPDGAALYDKDVKKQAQQLGLPGWE